MGRQAGLTLLETAIASLILVAGLAGVAGCFFTAVQSSIRVREQTTALALLFTKMEELKAETTLNPGHYSKYVTDPGTFQIKWEISSENPRRVTVTISRTSGPGPGEAAGELARASTLVGPRF